MVTATSAFAASLGYFDIWLVLLLSVLGDILPDVGYYALGYFGHQAVVRRACSLLRIPEARLDKTRAFLEKHQLKGLALFKYTPFLAVAGLILTGTNKMPFKKYVLADTLIGIPNTLFFTGAGYLAGRAFESVVSAVQRTEQVAAATVILALLLYWTYGRITGRLAERLEKEAGLET